MRARIIRGLIDTGSAARDFIQLARGSEPTEVSTITENTSAEAAEVLESFRSHRRRPGAEYILNGKRVIKAMDEQLRDYRSAAERFADSVTRGSYVSVRGEDRRFTVVEIWWDREAIRVGSEEGQEYVVPFKIIGPWPVEDEE